MTLTADKEGRVNLPNAKPGDLFEVEFSESGKLTLTKVQDFPQRPTPVRFEKRGKYTVGISDSPVSEQAIHEALADFP